MKSTRRGSDSPVHRREKTPRFQIPLDKWPVSPGEEAESAAPPEEKGPSPLPEIDISQRPDPARRPLYGCALNGAATAAVNLTDAVIIAHSPRSCAFYTWQNISSTGRKNLFNRGILMPSAISPNYETTEIGHAEAVFGGLDKLRSHVERAMERRPGAVIVIKIGRAHV